MHEFPGPNHYAHHAHNTSNNSGNPLLGSHPAAGLNNNNNNLMPPKHHQLGQITDYSPEWAWSDVRMTIASSYNSDLDLSHENGNKMPPSCIPRLRGKVFGKRKQKISCIHLTSIYLALKSLLL